jgi:hypothetical protein
MLFQEFREDGVKATCINTGPISERAVPAAEVAQHRIA